MTNQVVSPDQLSSPHEVRRMMVSALKQAQGLEHEFYVQCREAVRTASTRLTEHFSVVIQRQLPQWPDADCRRFAHHSGVPLDAIEQWRQRHSAMIAARGASSRADAETKSASSAKADSGGFFGAKKGREDEYRAAQARLLTAERAAKEAQERLKTATKSATEAAETLLGQCVAHAGQLAESAGYDESRVPQAILIEAAKRAKELTDHHDEEQSKLNAHLSAGIRLLSQRYGVAHG